MFGRKVPMPTVWAPSSRHLELVDSDHLEELALCPPLLQGPQKLEQP